MECKASSVRQYDPAKPRRARNLNNHDWESVKVSVARWHELGRTRTQMLQQLRKRGFIASPAQLNKHMARWKMGVKRKDKASVDVETGPRFTDSTIALMSSSEDPPAGAEGTYAELHPLEMQTSANGEANPNIPSAIQPCQSCDTAGMNQDDGMAAESADLNPSGTAYLENGYSPSQTAQAPLASISNPDVELSSEIINDRLPGPLTTGMQLIRNYRPGDTAKDLWDAGEKKCHAYPQCGCDKAGLSPKCHVWKLWCEMGDAADCLASAECLRDAFDLYHICFAKLFTRTGRILLRHQNSAVGTEQQSTCDETTARAIAGNMPILQMLIKAAIGSARTCASAHLVQHTNLLLDAALDVASQIDDPRTVSSLATLFSFHKENLAGILRQTPAFYSESSGITGASTQAECLRVFDPILSLDRLMTVIHPTIIDREHLFICARLSGSPHTSSLYLDSISEEEFSKPGKPFMDFLRFVDARSAQDDRCVFDPEDAVYPSFINWYVPEARLFLLWCHQEFLEWRISFEAYVRASRMRINPREALLRLYLFLVWRLRLFRSERTFRQQFNANFPAGLDRTGHSSTIFDAVFVLSKLILNLDGCDSPTNSRVLGSYEDYWTVRVENGISRILLSPDEFAWHYLRRVAGLLPGRWRTPEQTGVVEQKYLRAAILGPSGQEVTPLIHKNLNVQTLRLGDGINALNLKETEWPFRGRGSSRQQQPFGEDRIMSQCRGVPNKDKYKLSLEEREARRLAARNRIFGVQESGSGDRGGSRESSPADAASTYCRTVFSCCTFATSSSMSEDTRAFRHNARRYRDNTIAERKHRQQAPSYQSSANSEMDFERTSGIPTLTAAMS